MICKVKSGIKWVQTCTCAFAPFFLASPYSIHSFTRCLHISFLLSHTSRSVRVFASCSQDLSPLLEDDSWWLRSSVWGLHTQMYFHICTLVFASGLIVWYTIWSSRYCFICNRLFHLHNCAESSGILRQGQVWNQHSFFRTEMEKVRTEKKHTLVYY